MSGRFVTFEGGEGAGKSTQIGRLARRLEQRGVEVVTTREPGGSERAERIRGAVLGGGAKPLGRLAEAILFSAARHDHLEEKIRPALARGAFVLSDRFADSTRAYQGSEGVLDQKLLAGLERIVVEATKPDLTFILDLPAEVGLARAAARREAASEDVDRFEAEDLGFHERLREAFLAIARKEPERCVVIDAAADPDTVEERVWAAVEGRFAEDLAAAPARKRAQA
ncbi:MAG TPA: dTMP kinase [Beijerinckiaceae bacterium]|jgi:dTMP kinase